MEYNHYFKECECKHVDVYRVLKMFEVTDPCIQHAVKKLLVAGRRGSKDVAKDIKEAIDSLLRWQQMRDEDDMHAKKNNENPEFPQNHQGISHLDL